MSTQTCADRYTRYGAIQMNMQALVASGVSLSHMHSQSCIIEQNVEFAVMHNKHIAQCRTDNAIEMTR